MVGSYHVGKREGTDLYNQRKCLRHNPWFGRYSRRLFIKMKKDIRETNILDVIDISGKLWGKSSESKLSKAEKKGKEPAILRKGMSIKAIALKSGIQPTKGAC